MVEEVRSAVRRVPFEPFRIELSSGETLPVPHPDHILVGQTRVVVEDDKGVMNVLSAPHMTRIRWREREQAS